MATFAHRFAPAGMTLLQKLGAMSWGLVALLLLIAGLGFAMLYSAGGGNLEPWALRQMPRFAAGLAPMLALAMIDIRRLHRWSYAVYGVAFVLLVAVELAGRIGMGAQRWLDLGIVQLQPSEVMKIALVMALARYFHGLTQAQVVRWTALVVPLLLILVPTVLVMRQPDLGTAMLLLMGGAAVMFAAGIALRWFLIGGGLVLAALPIGWYFLHDYQRQRVLTYLDPESDPLGAGYHIMQSKIALGSGGVFGKGFLGGTQSQLNFLPEKQTDFIFTMLAEELGMAGALLLLVLYLLVLAYCLLIALRSSSQYGRLVVTGVGITFFLYVFINIAMVTGLIPVVGVPLPLISYGGSAMLTLMLGFGLVASVHVHRDVAMPRDPGGGI
ncbi:MAG: rod shape-determining protein RodA [Alphaproteobacteria bacterium]|nr:rod shape-determining protein RodA [Alphaproteobacteria bacterium]